MRIPIFIAIDDVRNAKQTLEDAGAEIHDSTAGSWEITYNDKYRMHAFLLGKKDVGGTIYKIFTVLVFEGDQRKVYRWFKNNLDVLGPYTLKNAPNALKNYIRELRATRDENGDIVAPGSLHSVYVLAGESITAELDLDYVEGLIPEEDEIVILEENNE